MSGRSRRVVQKKGAAEVAAALAQLNAAKAGSKRLDTFELKEEKAVYDVVDDEQYAQLVTKRRIEAGDFIEEDDGEYGADMGEEDDFFNGDGNLTGKKRKDGAGKDASAAKRQAAEEAAKARKNKERLHAMFAKAAAQPSAAKANTKEADDLLEDILGELGGEPAKPSAAAPGNRFSRVQPAPAAAPRAPAAAAGSGGAMKTFVRGGVSGGAARGGTVGAGSSRPVAAAAPAAGGVIGRKRPLLQQQPAQSLSFAGAAAAAGADDGHEEEYQMPVDDGMVFDAEEVAVKQEPVEQDFSFAPPGRPSELSGDPFKAPADIKQEQQPSSDTDAAAAKTAGPKRFSDDKPAGPDVAASPATGWAEVYGGDVDGDEAAAAAAADAAAAAANGSSSPAAVAGAEGMAGGVDGIVTQENGDVPFFFMDAYEAPERPDVLYLFGKVSASNSSSSNASSPGPKGGSSWQSCCVVVPNLHRSLLVVPRPEVFDDSDGEIAALEAAVAADPERKMELLQLLHARCTDLKAELRTLMVKHGIKTMRLVPVKRNYVFEDPTIPAREQWVIKVRYSASLPTLPMGISGTHFVAVAGTNQSPLEALLLKRGLRGPGWCLLTGATRKESTAQVSWCKVEVELPNAKGIRPAEPGSQLAAKPSPPLTVAALNLRLHMDPKSQQQEILAASVVHMSGVSPDAPTPRAVWSRPDALRNFSIVRKLDGRPWPTGFEALVAQENNSARGRLNGGTMISTSPNERALLGCLLAKLAALDADVLVGHNIGAYELAVLMGRLQTHKVQLWSRLGRLKRSNFPKMTGGGHTFGGGAAPGLMSVLAGRLLCDTYLSARELVREVDYTLKTLAKNLLGQERSEVPSTEVPARYENAAGLRQLLLCGESDAWLALGLAMQLSVLPLTKQLSVVSGSLWGKTLQGARAQRIEMLLLHEFHDRKFILPDKLTARDKAAQVSAQANKSAKAKGSKGKKAGKAGAAAAERGAAEDAEEHDGLQPPEDEEDEAAATTADPKAGLSKKAGGKGPQYAGGLVLEPKKGLYDKFVIMLDFNSLYPSIIQEYNICFTTVKRPTDGSMPALPTAASGGNSSSLAPLPTVIQGLVRKRREVKAQMKSCRDPVLLQQLTIRQQALKLTANSMYGCLGFSNSRFFARPLAELITSQGRDILQSTVDLVNDMGVPGLEVIYGDTDSIMIHTNSNDYDAAEALGAKVKAAVNRRYRLLEIELDAVYRSMLLLKKKKYAAVKVEKANNGSAGLVEVLEAKGLDMVRRDWSKLSKDTGNYVLQQILSGQPKAQVVEAVHEKLRSVAAALSAGQLPLSAFVITKQLTKRPEDYPDAKGQPHVQVALRRRAAGKRDGVMAGETVPYIICIRLSSSAADGSSTDAAAAAAGTPQQSDQQQPDAGASASPQQQQDTPSASPAAVAGNGDAAAASPAAAAAAGGSSGGVRALTVAAAASRGVSAGGSIAERAFHPDELRSDPNLVIDAEYYLAQQVLPVVMRLCAPIEGANASHLAQCLGLDASRYGNSGNSNTSMAAALREEALQVTGSLLDDDTHYSRCDPLMLTSSNNTSWEFKGVRAAIKSGSPGSCLLTPPDAVGDELAELTPAQLANQAMLAARRAIVRYYDGQLVSDDEVSGAGGALRDVVLAPVPADAPPGSMPMAANAAAATGKAAAGGGSGVLLSRAYGESQLYTQLCYIVRLLDVRAALDTLPDKQRRQAAEQQLASGASGGNALKSTLQHAAGLVARLRDSSAYRWVDLGAVFSRMRAGRKAGAAAAGTAGPRAAAPGVRVGGC